MVFIDQKQLLALLSDIRGASFATIITETDARLKKTGNPFGSVVKLSRVNVCLGFQYTAAVNRQRVREDAEPDFEARPRQWGERIQGTVLVEHRGKVYLETKVERSLSHQYFRADNGTPLSDEDVRPFLPARGKSRQDVEREIIVRDYRLDSIRAIVMGGETYMLQTASPVAVTV